MKTASPIDRPSRHGRFPTYTHPKGAACPTCGSTRSKKDWFEAHPWCQDRVACDDRIDGRR